ncbi:MAG: methionyl-tRNA formyltransferase, partial [Chloroflexi bacterium]|nr:methionyl-tRNA formyltransferase [Chloroflexota bacterium]
MTGSPLRILFLGTPEYAVPSLERLVADGYDVVRVYTRPDQPAGRSGAPTASAVKRAALRHGLSVRQPRSLRAAVELQQLRELAPDLLVVAAYGLILPQEILEIPRYKSLNVHPSLLPQHRGASPIAGALLAGDAETGVTIMLMDAGMDTGPILTQRRVAIGPADTSGSLTTRLAQVGAELLSETIPLWVGDELRPQPQDETQATYTRLLTKADGQVDWSQPAHLIARQAQAYQPWPGLYTRWQARQLKLLQVEALPDVTSPGQR